MTNHQNGPPKEDRLPESREPINGLSSHHATPTACEYIAGLHRRREASYRLPMLDHCGRSDPWYYGPPTAGYLEAVGHLLDLGLTPAPDIKALRSMWKRGGPSRRAAEAIARRWEAA